MPVVCGSAKSRRMKLSNALNLSFTWKVVNALAVLKRIYAHVSRITYHSEGFNMDKYEYYAGDVEQQSWYQDKPMYLQRDYELL